MSKEQEMAALFARWRESGQSLMACGRQTGVAYSRLLYWRKKFEGRSKRAEPREVEFQELVPVTLAREAQPAPAPHFEVRLQNGIAVGVADGFEGPELERLVAILRAC